MENLKITLLQVPLAWENKEENLLFLEKNIDQITAPTDLIVLPEMFNTGFSMNSKELAEDMDGKTIAWMHNLAQRKNCAITGSLIIKQNANYYNRLIWMLPSGKMEVYNKRHLFRMANENKHYTEGEKKLIVDYRGWKICLMVCYDLRFPVWSRRTEHENYDLLIYVANWPEQRSHAWKSLLVARAIENQCFVAGVNRIGKDGNGINYSGDSVLINFLGEKISSDFSTKESEETLVLAKSDLLAFREKFPADKDADSFSINLIR